MEEHQPPQAAGHASASTEAHRKEAPDSVLCFVLTISDTRTEETDQSGLLIRQLLEARGHRVVGYRIVADDAAAIAGAVEAACSEPSDTEAIILTGGTGIGPRDVTPEALLPLVTKPIPGFGELFRMLSWPQIGAAAVLSRAFAGLIGRTLLFALPGGKNAVLLGMEQLILPELGHLVREVRPERRRTAE